MAKVLEEAASSYQLIVETFQHLIQKERHDSVTKASDESLMKSNLSKTEESVVSDSDRLCRQWPDLLSSGAMSDVRVQCRGEKLVTMSPHGFRPPAPLSMSSWASLSRPGGICIR